MKRLLCAMALVLAGPGEFAGAAETPIESRAALEAYLAAHPQSPFDALSPGARERFLYALRFNERGLVGMDPNELADELDDAQIHAVLELFGPTVLTYAPPSRAEETQSLERRVTKREGLGPAERRYTDWYKATRDVPADAPDRDARLAALFDSQLGTLYAPSELRRIDDHELRLLRVAARSVALRTHDQRHVDAFHRVFEERMRRNLVSSDDIATLRELLLAQRRFGEARGIGNKYPTAKLPPLPNFSDEIGDASGVVTVWRLDPAGKRLTRSAVDVAPLQIFVTASCHFSKEAARDIGADAVLGPLFEKRAQWLVAAPGDEPIEDVRGWNAELPRTPVAMIYDRAEWSFLPHWNMPTFFVVRDGKVVDSVSGWAGGDPRDRAALVAVLKRTGLLGAD